MTVKVYRISMAVSVQLTFCEAICCDVEEAVGMTDTDRSSLHKELRKFGRSSGACPQSLASRLMPRVTSR
jgi:hypothetical protein